MRKLLVTSALPYVNGQIHVGQIAGAYLPADTFVRYHRLKGNDVVYICGSDEHGVPITIAAEEQGISPQELVDRNHPRAVKAYEGLGISFDNYSRTSLPIHKEITQQFFLKVMENGYITQQETQQLRCTSCHRFLPDRYVEGTCPNCGAGEARGDQCDNCGWWYDAWQLVDPVCRICGGIPELTESTHWFFRLSAFQERLEKWMEGHPEWRDNVRNFCSGWFKEGLRDRDITRNMEWGVPVPLEEAEGQVFYVWFDAPIGYMSSTREWIEGEGQSDWRPYWCDPDRQIVHFIGKDNIVFHAIVWPAMLMAHGDYQLPANVPANEFLNIGGQKISKSRNLMITVEEYLEAFPPDYLRYYITMNAPETKDADFTWEEFQARSNGELADVLGNFVNRTLTFTRKYFDNKVPGRGELTPTDTGLIKFLEESPEKVGDLIETFQFRRACRELMGIARTANKYFNDKEPWRTRKDDLESCGTTIHLSVQVLRTLAILWSPVIPFSAERIWKMAEFSGSIQEQSWDEAGQLAVPSGHELGTPEVLFPKIEDSAIAAQVEKLGTSS